MELRELLISKRLISSILEDHQRQKRVKSSSHPSAFSNNAVIATVKGTNNNRHEVKGETFYREFIAEKKLIHLAYSTPVDTFSFEGSSITGLKVIRTRNKCFSW